jgi:hypothetical protein
MEDKGGTAIQKSIAVLERIKRQLAEPGSVNFIWILGKLQEMELADADHARVAELTVDKIGAMFRHGSWRDLEGALELLNFLKTEIRLPDEYLQRIAEFYARYSYGFLLSLSPNLINGDCWIDGEGYKRYDRIEYTRMRLHQEQEHLGLKKEEITDELIDSLWRMREVLILMHINQVDPGSSLTTKKILALPQANR